MKHQQRTNGTTPIILIMIALVLSACGGQASAPAAPTTAAPAAPTPAAPVATVAPAASAPTIAATSAPAAEGAATTAPAADDSAKYGGTLTIAVNTEPDGIDADYASSANAFLINRNICDSLVARAQDGSFVPFLATEWDISADGLAYTFTLRQDVTFHDGTPFNAEAVKFNLERVAAPELKSRLAISYLGPFQAAEVVDPYTVKISFSKPNAAFMNTFASWIGMVSPTAAQKVDAATFNWAPVCSGPFKFEEYVPQSHVSFIANEAYNWAPSIWNHQGRPYLDKVVFRFVPDPSTRTAVLENGEVDAIRDVSPSDFTRLSASSDLTVVEQELAGPGIHYVPNLSRPPFDDKLVRQALIYATDQEEIKQLVFQGVGQTIHSVFNAATPCFDQQASDMYRFDLAKANALLDQAGWTMNATTGIREKDGKPLKMTISSLTIGNASEMNEVLINTWKQVGIEATSELLASSNIQLPRAQGADFDIMWRSFGANDPNVLSTLFQSKNSGPNKGWNFTHKAFPELDALLDKGDVTTDATARCEVYAQAQRMIMDEALIIPIQPRLTYTAARKTVADLPSSWSGVVDVPFYNTSIAK